jgi:DNA polymerase III epsilon subunit-like protein
MKLVIFDLETTGLDKTKDQIIQFAGIKIDTETNKIEDELNLYICPTGDSWHIDIAAYFKHHITPEFLKDKPNLKDVAQKIIEFIGDNSVLTYNGNGFDIPFLKNELNKYGFDIDFINRDCYDAFLEEKRRHGINLENTYKKYKGKTMEEAGLTAHDAFSDIKATYAVFYAQQSEEKYGPEKMIGEDGIVKEMDFNGEIKPCMTIGKYRGVSLEYIAKYDQGYLNWAVSDKCGFMQSTKDYIKQYIK